MRWGMTIEEAEKVLQKVGQKDIQKNQQDYSKWFEGADFGIHAVYSLEPRNTFCGQSSEQINEL
jgi:hypothetical protein